MKLTVLRCIHCAHEWIPRVLNGSPRCPACNKTRPGEKEPPRKTCGRCKYRYTPRRGSKTMRCPQCGFRMAKGGGRG